MEYSITFNKLMLRCCSSDGAERLLQKNEALTLQTSFRVELCLQLSSSLLTYCQMLGAMLKSILVEGQIGMLEVQMREAAWANHRTESL